MVRSSLMMQTPEKSSWQRKGTAEKLLKMRSLEIAARRSNSENVVECMLPAVCSKQGARKKKRKENQCATVSHGSEAAALQPPGGSSCSGGLAELGAECSQYPWLAPVYVGNIQNVQNVRKRFHRNCDCKKISRNLRRIETAWIG